MVNKRVFRLQPVFYQVSYKGVEIIPMTNARQRTDQSVRIFFFSVALASIAILFMIMVFLFMEGLPIFKKISLFEFVFGKFWYPTSDPPDFGIFPLIVASIAVTLVSAIISIPLGVMTAVYLAELAHKRVAEIMKPIVELLAALPSVVIGFFGMVVVAPLLQNTFGIPTGLNLFNAALMLSFMSVPTICSLSEDAIYSVPVALKEGSLALGATHWETLIRGHFAGFDFRHQHGDHPGNVQGHWRDHGGADGGRGRSHDPLIADGSGAAHAGQHRRGNG